MVEQDPFRNVFNENTRAQIRRIMDDKDARSVAQLQEKLQKVIAHDLDGADGKYDGMIHKVTLTHKLDELAKLSCLPLFASMKEGLSRLPPGASVQVHEIARALASFVEQTMDGSALSVQCGDADFKPRLIPPTRPAKPASGPRL